MLIGCLLILSFRYFGIELLLVLISLMFTIIGNKQMFDGTHTLPNK